MSVSIRTIRCFESLAGQDGWPLVLLTLLTALSGLTGCQTQSDARVTPWVVTGEYGRARVLVKDHLVNDRSDRRYLLDRMRLGILTLADGYPESAGLVFEEVYDVLRTQGINRDKTVASVVLNEDLKFWKGEPFEQALALAYYGLQQGSLGRWDNMRAAARNSLFRLRDFGTDDKGQRINTLEIAQKALAYERAQAAQRNSTSSHSNSSAGGASGGDYLNSGYAVRDSNFTLGYMLHGIASQQMGRLAEARDYYAVATQINPSVQPVCDELLRGRHDAILIVAFGLGPQKAGYGPDNALAEFRPRYSSDDQPLIVRVGTRQVGQYPLACDVNAMALDHMWNNLEDVRRAKSEIGSGLVVAGATAVAVGSRLDKHRNETVIAGLGAMVAGAFLKAGAHVDTRYCDVMPQRVYVVPVKLTKRTDTVTLEVAGRPLSRLVLTGLSRQLGSTPHLRYVHLVSGPGGTGRTAPETTPETTPGGDPGAISGGAVPSWATSGKLYYDVGVGPGPGAYETARIRDGWALPYILGGRSVRPPDAEAIRFYQESGNLQGVGLVALQELYRGEAIRWRTEDQQGYAGLHVLEGGRSLVAPQPGTAGFTRLFGQNHEPYRPRTDAVRQTAAVGGTRKQNP